MAGGGKVTDEVRQEWACQGELGVRGERLPEGKPLEQPSESLTGAQQAEDRPTGRWPSESLTGAFHGATFGKPDWGTHHHHRLRTDRLEDGFPEEVEVNILGGFDPP